MIASVAKKMNEKEKGFTLIELLVVVVIIGILAAIAIPAFLKQRENAWAAQVESAMKNATTAAESYSTKNNGSYNGLTIPTLEANGLTKTTDVTITPKPAADGKTYELTGKHEKLAETWSFDSSKGKIERSGTVSGGGTEGGTED